MMIVQLVQAQAGTMAVLWDQESRKPSVSYMEVMALALLEDEDGERWCSPMIDGEADGLIPAMDLPNYLGTFGPHSEEEDEYWLEKARKAKAEAKAAEKRKGGRKKPAEEEFEEEDEEEEEDDDEEEYEEEDEEEEEEEGTEVRSRAAR